MKLSHCSKCGQDVILIEDEKLKRIRKLATKHGYTELDIITVGLEQIRMNIEYAEAKEKILAIPTQIKERDDNASKPETT